MTNKAQTSDRRSLLSNVTSATISEERSEKVLRDAIVAAGFDQSDVAETFRKARYMLAMFPTARKVTTAMERAADKWHAKTAYVEPTKDKPAKPTQRTKPEQDIYNAAKTKYGRLLKDWGLVSTHVRAGNQNAKGKADKAKGKAAKAKVAATLPTAKSPASAAQYFLLQCAAWTAYAEKNAKQFTLEQLTAITMATDIVRDAFPKAK
jgi:hypothetical protein